MSAEPALTHIQLDFALPLEHKDNDNNDDRYNRNAANDQYRIESSRCWSRNGTVVIVVRQGHELQSVGLQWLNSDIQIAFSSKLAVDSEEKQNASANAAKLE